MKILCADDDRDLLALIAFTLSQAGYLVVRAGDGTSAIRSFEAEAPDLVLLDINMPGASGFQVCEAIRAQSRVPVMMLTVRGEEEDLVRALELGADDYMTKPFSPRTLLARVKALLRRAGLENSARTGSLPVCAYFRFPLLIPFPLARFPLIDLLILGVFRRRTLVSLLADSARAESLIFPPGQNPLPARFVLAAA